MDSSEVINKLKANGWTLTESREVITTLKSPGFHDLLVSLILGKDLPQGTVKAPRALHQSKSEVMLIRGGRNSPRLADIKGTLCVIQSLLSRATKRPHMESSSPTFPDASLAGDTLDEAFDMAKEAIEGWIECTVDDGQDIPKPSAMEEIRKIPNSSGWIFELLTWTSQSFGKRRESEYHAFSSRSSPPLMLRPGKQVIPAPATSRRW